MNEASWVTEARIKATRDAELARVNIEREERLALAEGRPTRRG